MEDLSKVLRTSHDAALEIEYTVLQSSTEIPLPRRKFYEKFYRVLWKSSQDNSQRHAMRTILHVEANDSWTHREPHRTLVLAAGVSYGIKAQHSPLELVRFCCICGGSGRTSHDAALEVEYTVLQSSTEIPLPRRKFYEKFYRVLWKSHRIILKDTPCEQFYM